MSQPELSIYSLPSIGNFVSAGFLSKCQSSHSTFGPLQKEISETSQEYYHATVLQVEADNDQLPIGDRRAWGEKMAEEAIDAWKQCQAERLQALKQMYVNQRETRQKRSEADVRQNA